MTAPKRLGFPATKELLQAFPPASPATSCPSPSSSSVLPAPCQSPAWAWHTEPPVSNAVRRSTRSHVSLERVVSKMVAWLPSKGLLVSYFFPAPSFFHSFTPVPSRVGGGTRSASSMGSSDQLSPWSLPCFLGFMSKRQ